MVFITIPQALTEEEELLQQKFAKLKKKKKALAAMKTPKVEKQESLTETLKRPVEAAADATEQAKKLLKSGAIKVEPDRRDQQTFKRTKRQKDSEKPVGFHPFTYSGSTESTEDKSEVVRTKPKYNLYDNFVSASDSKPELSGNNEQHERRQVPRRGNTIYVFSQSGVTEDLLQTAFANIGNILNISVETAKGCGFVTFEKMESADQAISEVNGAMVNGVMLKVSIARRQPPVESVSRQSPDESNVQDGSTVSWSSIAASSSQKGDFKDKREIVTYDDDEIF